MIVIKSIKFTPSEAVDMLREAMTGWRSVYASYVVKISNSGTEFSQYVELEDAIRRYVENEPKDDQPKLENYRGKALVPKCAVVLQPLDKDKVPTADRAAIRHLMTTGGIGNGISNKSLHMTDPETGKPKGGTVAVQEFYVNGEAGRRATKRTEGSRTTYYYSSTHAYNTYEYQRLY